jgi:hypothetical protein
MSRAAAQQQLATHGSPHKKRRLSATVSQPDDAECMPTLELAREAAGELWCLPTAALAAQQLTAQLPINNS